MYILQVAEENHRALSTDTVEGKFRRLDSLVNTKINTVFQFISSVPDPLALPCTRTIHVHYCQMSSFTNCCLPRAQSEKMIIYCAPLAERLRKNRFFTDKTSALCCWLRRCPLINSLRLQNWELDSNSTLGNSGWVLLIWTSADLWVRPSPRCSWYCHSSTYSSCIF